MAKDKLGIELHWDSCSIFLWYNDKTLVICLPKRTDGVLSVSQPCPSVWNSLADYLCDPALELNSFMRQLDVLVYTLLGTMYLVH